jgi:NCAIR mutase (PurE)-related protein
MYQEMAAMSFVHGSIVYHELARIVTMTAHDTATPRTPDPATAARIVVATAGTTDVPVAEEAAVVLEATGQVIVDRIYDVGVAGLHRVIRALPRLQKADVVIVCAGMDGALPSVVGGLVRCPVLAVPTSIGYGAAFGGVGALLTMLNSCSPGVAVVNIDNGFGAAAMAYKMVRGKST